MKNLPEGKEAPPPGVNWELNCRSGEGQISLRGAEDARLWHLPEAGACTTTIPGLRHSSLYGSVSQLLKMAAITNHGLSGFVTGSPKE